MSNMSKEVTKKPRRKRRAFTPEFKTGAVKLVLERGKTLAEVAKNLDLNPSTVSLWVKRARASSSKPPRGTLNNEEKEELARLRKEVRELRIEREILKKAAAFFAKENA